ncbi:MAG: deoxyhypusine synthase [Candidatus Aenigmarchaeota archaeon]|nr:deoxyhypusine synthase [Candidatus Aenigmarchaeota archaeon]
MNLKKARKNILKRSSRLEGLHIKGYDFSKKFNMEQFLNSYKATGFQATQLRLAIDIIKEMKREKATVFLGCTSNMVSSGLREIIAYLARKRLVDVLVTTAGGVEEDVIKTLKPFLLGSFHADDKQLRKHGINRIGNIFVPNDRYIAFEKLMMPFLQKTHEKQAAENKITTASEFIFNLGKEVKGKDSILYWATRNKIPVFCPALTDGSIGDMLYFFMNSHPDFKLDIASDIVKITEIAMNSKKTGAIILGGGLAKHHVMNANLFRGGADYAVYISTGSEYDGSVAGARPSEAVSWGKKNLSGRSVHVEGDATIIFPLVVAGFLNKNLPPTLY